MDDEKQAHRSEGRFLTRHRRQSFRSRRWLMVAMLLVWDGVLLYMIVGCLIAPAYGAAFVAVISVYLGYQL